MPSALMAEFDSAITRAIALAHGRARQRGLLAWPAREACTIDALDIGPADRTARLAEASWRP